MTLTYIPPKGGPYYISGVDAIKVELPTDSNVNAQQDIVTWVKGLVPMPGSGGLVGGWAYYFVPQNNHGDQFYGTPATDGSLAQIANDFAQNQVDFQKGAALRTP